MSITPGRTWPLREVPAELRERYLTEGLWTDETVGQTVHAGLAGKQDAVFEVHSTTRPWQGTMGDVHTMARRFAGSLRERGVRPGDVVVFQLPNCVEAAAVFWGAAYVGAVVVPVVHFYGLKELSHIVEVTRPEVVVTMDRFGSRNDTPVYADLLGARDGSWFVVGGEGELPSGAEAFSAALQGPELEEPLPADPDAPAVIAFTSGTTSNPKGVIHTHRTIGFEAKQLGRLGGGGTAARVLTGAPVGHFIGMLGSLLTSLHDASAEVHFVDVWDPAHVLRLMKEEGLLVGGGATYFVTSLLDHPDFTPEHLQRMPVAGLGGSTVPDAVTERLTSLGIAAYRSYGSTELPSATGSGPDEPLEKRCTTDGRPLAGVELRLDEEGQILLRGAELFMGYTDAEQTAKVFTEDGWYKTGDVGVVDADGYLTITDRLSDIIIRGGENISAREVEDLLLGLHDVLEAVVVGVPDPLMGERAAAVVRVRPGRLAPTLEDVRAHLAGLGLAKQKWPEALYEVAELPRTASGKVQKTVLRQRLRDSPRLNAL